MAEYYPLLAKAVGSLPNSTPDMRRVVYERARKALIGQLRTLHPPVPDEEIDHESVELDRAIARLEDEIAKTGAPTPSAPAAPPPSPPPADVPPPAPKQPAPLVPRPARPPAPPRAPGAGPAPKPFAPLRTKLPTPKTTEPVPATGEAAPPTGPADPAPPLVDEVVPPPLAPEPDRGPSPANGRPRIDGQRPIAPQPPAAKPPKRQMWIIWVGILVVVGLVAGVALKLRDHPEALVKTKPADQQAQGDSGKISERVGDTHGATDTTSSPPAATPSPEPESKPETQPEPSQSAAAPEPPTAPEPSAAPPATPNNPEVPVAQRAALLVEAPTEPNKVKTFLGNVVWKLNNSSDNPGDATGLAVEADVDLPDDKMKATITFEKNTDSSLPASHTIKVRFFVQPGSMSGDVKQISVPALRKEDSPTGDPLAGVTVPIIQDSFLVGLSPGNAEAANMDLLRALQWIDIPMQLTSGKIAKLTFEKGPSGQRDLSDAITAWQK